MNLDSAFSVLELRRVLGDQVRSPLPASAVVGMVGPLGTRLRFYARNARVSGQAALVPLDSLVADHSATVLSPFEQANLAALALSSGFGFAGVSRSVGPN